MEVRTHPLPPPGLACVMQDLKLLSFNVQWFRDLGALFSSFGCFVFESWLLCFRVVCFVFEFWVHRFRDLGASCFGRRFRNYLISSYVLTLGPAFKCCLHDVKFLRIVRSSDFSCSLNPSYTKHGELCCASFFYCVRFIDHNRRHRSMHCVILF